MTLPSALRTKFQASRRRPRPSTIDMNADFNGWRSTGDPRIDLALVSGRVSR